MILKYKIRNMYKSIIKWFKNIPYNFKRSWQHYKIFAKATYENNKEMCDKALGVKK